jgi:hypothetical protein
VSFGTTGAEQNQANQLQALMTQLTGAANTGAQRSQQTFNQFEKSLTPVLSYWRNILSGGAAAESAAAPGINAINTSYGNEAASLNALLPRGGQAGGALANLTTTRQGAIGNLIAGEQSTAATNLEGIAGLLSGTSLGESGINLQGLTSAAGTGSNLLSFYQQQQQSENQLFGALGEGLGSLVGGLATGGVFDNLFSGDGGGGGNTSSAGSNIFNF